MTQAQTTDWRIVEVRAAGGALYDVDLELGDGDAYAYALLAVGDRAARGTHEPADWAVRVEACSDDRARDWLWADEHEYAIGRLCVTGYVP
jgi:hypothetical protein